MYKNERQANQALSKWLDEQEQKQYSARLEQAERIMAMPKPYAFRLAALNAAGPENARTWY